MQHALQSLGFNTIITHLHLLWISLTYESQVTNNVDLTILSHTQKRFNPIQPYTGIES